MYILKNYSTQHITYPSFITESVNLFLQFRIFQLKKVHWQITAKSYIKKGYQ